MAIRLLFKKLFIGALCVLFATTLFAQKQRGISGALVDSDGNNVVNITVLLLSEDGTEVQRTETSKKRIGRSGGKFEFKKVLPGNYTIEADGGKAGKVSTSVEVADKDVKLGEISLSKVKVVAKKTPTEETPTEGPAPDAVEFTPDPGKDYILNELSFEIKKMTAELKYLNEELEN